MFATGLETTLVIVWQGMWLLSAFAPKNLPEAQPKRFELISLVEEILRHSSIDRDIYSCSLLCRSTAKKNKWGRNK